MKNSSRYLMRFGKFLERYGVFFFMLGMAIAWESTGPYALLFGLGVITLYVVYRLWRARDIIGNATESIWIMGTGKPSDPECWEKGEFKQFLKDKKLFDWKPKGEEHEEN